MYRAEGPPLKQPTMVREALAKLKCKHFAILIVIY